MTDRRPKTRLTKAERRRLLLTQARRLFAAQGDAEVTLEQIAEASGVTAAMAVKTFANRPALVQAIAEEFHADLLAGSGAALDPQGGLNAIFHMFLRAALAPESPARVLMKLLAEGGRETRAAIARGLTPSVAALGELIRAGQQEGVFRRSLDPPQAAWELLRSLFGLALLGEVEPAPPADADHAAPAIDCLLHGLLKTDV